MESSMKTRNDQEKKKMAVKVGIGNGGGIGAVVLLGGALATAALASAFVARKKRRSPGENRRHLSPPPEINQRNERDEENKGQEFVFPDQPSHLHENPSEVTKDVEADNDDDFLVSTQNSTQVEKPSVEEINGENMKLQNDAISDGSTISKEGFPLSDEKLSFDPQNMKDEDDEYKIQLTKEVIIPNEISKESEENIKQVCVGENKHSDDGVEKEEIGHDEAIEIAYEIQPREEENIVAGYDQEKIIVDDNAFEGVCSGEMEREGLGGFCSDGGEISEEKRSDEAIDGTKLDLGANGLELIEEDISQNQETGQKAILPGFKGQVIEHENVNRDENESEFSTEIVEIVKEDEAMEGNQEDGVEFTEASKLVEEEQEICDQADEEIDPIEVKEEKISREKEEENACLFHSSTENKQFGLAMVKEEVIDIEVTKEDGPNEEVAESLEMNQDEPTVQLVVRQPKDENDLGRKVEDEVEEPLIISPENEVSNEEVGEILEVNQDESTVQFVVHQTNDENAPGGKVENEVEEELIISLENTEGTKEEATNAEVAGSLEMNQDESTVQSVVCQPNDENAPGGNVENEVAEEFIIFSPEDNEVTEEEVPNEETAEIPELNENNTTMQFVVCQPKDDQEYDTEDEAKEEIISPEDTEVSSENKTSIFQPIDSEDAMKSVPNEVQKELIISPGDIEVTKENGSNEEVSGSLAMNQEASIEVSICQPKEHEDDLERNNEKEAEEELISTEKITNEVTKEETAENLDEVKDDMLMEMSGDDEEEKGQDADDIKDLDDENVSIATVDSSTESELYAVWPAESLQKTQVVKLIDQELEGKIQEDKAIKGDEYDGQIIGEDYSSFGKGKLEKASIKKYVVEMCNRSDLRRRKLVIGILSVVSSLSCSWFFDLSFVKLSLIVFLTMAIVINGY